MVRSVQSIEQDLAALSEILETLTQEFCDTYREYLEALGKSAQQQLILASYHLCTQGFPEDFLKLSFQQRQDLQHTLRRLACNLQQQLNSLAARPCPNPISDGFHPASPKDQNSESSAASPHPASDNAAPSAATGSQTEPLDAPETLIPLGMPDPLAAISPEQSEFKALSLESPLESLSDPSLGLPQQSSVHVSEKPSQHAPNSSLTPHSLFQWQEEIEDAVLDLLKNASHAANRCLQGAGILSSTLPEPVLEIASKAEMIADQSAGTPNLLTLRLEAEDDRSQEEPLVTQLIVIHLRLSEIEFANPELLPWRTKIRDLSNRLNQLQREYKRKHREKAIAEAESAWRSSWFED
jgi:hypothetical protein